MKKDYAIILAECYLEMKTRDLFESTPLILLQRHFDLTTVRLTSNDLA